MSQTPQLDSGPYSPRALGFRAPAEWEPQEATWLSWPNLTGESYSHMLEEVRPAFLRLIEEIAEVESVYLNVRSDEERDFVESNLSQSALERTRFFLIPTREPWCRDHGPTFLVKPESKDGGGAELGAVDWVYNGWGGKYPPYWLDNRAAGWMTRAVGAQPFPAGVVFEGGSVEVNGTGSLITSRSCILNENRNPGLTEEEATRLLKEYLNVTNVIWVDGAHVEGDDTDAHVDVTTRFAGRNVVIAACDESGEGENHRYLDLNILELENSADETGKALEVVRLPMPQERVFCDTWKTALPLGYANFYILNEKILMPAFYTKGEAEDPEYLRIEERAAKILAEMYPDRKVVPVDCRSIIYGQGAIHCLTQQVPKLPA